MTERSALNFGIKTTPLRSSLKEWSLQQLIDAGFCHLGPQLAGALSRQPRSATLTAFTRYRTLVRYGGSMRWDHLTLSDDSAQDALFGVGDVLTRTFDTPEFRGMTFYETRARSILNKVPASSRMPFEWTVNPYRGCSHACRYCFARRTHEYLDLDAGLDFDTKIVVKVNAPELIRRELASPRWAGSRIAMGTNVDPYQRVEGRYRLMPGILEALRDARNPFSILTKGTLVLRDLEVLREAAEVTDVAVNVSVGFVDETLWRQVEPGTPAPRARLSVCRALTDVGIGCGVLMAPILATGSARSTCSLWTSNLSWSSKR